MIRPQGPAKQKASQSATKRQVIRMEYHTFLQAIIQIPAQIIRRSRQLIYRLLTYRESVETLLLIHKNVSRPLRC